MTQYYLIVTWGDVDPDLCGPFSSEPDRDSFAREFRKDNGDGHGIFKLTLIKNKPEVEAYPNIFFEEGD